MFESKIVFVAALLLALAGLVTAVWNVFALIGVIEAGAGAFEVLLLFGTLVMLGFLTTVFAIVAVLCKFTK